MCRPIRREIRFHGRNLRRKQGGWLPSNSDREFIYSLMKGVFELGKMAAWIAPPERGINNQPVDYEYVRLQ